MLNRELLSPTPKKVTPWYIQMLKFLGVLLGLGLVGLALIDAINKVVGMILLLLIMLLLCSCVGLAVINKGVNASIETDMWQTEAETLAPSLLVNIKPFQGKLTFNDQYVLALVLHTEPLGKPLPFHLLLEPYPTTGPGGIYLARWLIAPASP